MLPYVLLAANKQKIGWNTSKAISVLNLSKLSLFLLDFELYLDILTVSFVPRMLFVPPMYLGLKSTKFIIVNDKRFYFLLRRSRRLTTLSYGRFGRLSDDDSSSQFLSVIRRWSWKPCAATTRFARLQIWDQSWKNRLHDPPCRKSSDWSVRRS